MNLTTRRGVLVLAAAIVAALLLAVGVAIGAVPRLVDASGPRPGEAASAPSTVGDPAPAEPPPTTAPPLPVAESSEPFEPSESTNTPTPPPTPAPPVTAPPTTTAPTTVPPPTTPAPPRLPPGQRVEPTAAQLQAAVAQLHQRIPLFAPTDGQLRTFAEAVCVSFDQGQTRAQVESTVSQAVSHIQGASLSAPDAAFAVQLVVQLRCPGYLP